VTLASIPSPDSGVIELGPLTIHMYGLMLLLAIAVCILVTGIRWTRRGGDWDLVLRVAVWGVAAGIVGARAYHVLTSWNEVPDEWWGPFAVWKGGLGVWGGIFLGCVVGAVIVKRSGNDVAKFADAVAPGLLIAQGIGRIGNWWNQELYGEPTDRPWALEIAAENRVPGYEASETFHPIFLYELIYNLTVAGLLMLIGWRFRIKPPGLFALYVALYCFGRFFEELWRIDPAHEFGPLRLNGWVSAVLFVLATGFFIYWQFLRDRRPREGRRIGLRREKKEPPPPKMAIPKGRVRPSR
jgi:prolipoprotein diacylglyceryl transferase